MTFLVDGQEVYSTTNAPSPGMLGRFGVAIQLNDDACDEGFAISIGRFSLRTGG